MNNEELKKKIAEILKKAMEPIEYGGDGEHAPEVHHLTEEEIADALIAAGIGDVKDLQAQVDVLEITNIALQAGYNDAEKDRLYWVDKYKEAEHRAEVAERALYNACCEQNKHWCVQCDSFAECDTSNEVCIEAKKHAEELIKQAEKELAGGKGNDDDR